VAYINPPRGAIHNNFYSSAVWKKLREAVIRERGLICQDREHPAGKRVERVDLDHIVELKDGGAALDRRNVLLRCHSCHMRKTSEARRNRREMEYWARRIRMKEGSP
jgi:5-methylcytosine-specific restriction enzyme A